MSRQAGRTGGSKRRQKSAAWEDRLQLIIAGVSHKDAPLALRERLAIPAPALPEALARLREVVGEGCILSTCNRTEIVAIVGHAVSGEPLLARFLAEVQGLPVGEIAAQLRVGAHADAAQRLFRIAAGLDSLILGEDQILAQLKTALGAAAEAGTLGPVLHRLGHAALATGKRVRTDTAIAQGNLSVVSAALREAAERLGPLRERRVLIIGAGATAELALKHLTKEASARPARLALTNRTPERALALASRYEAEALPWAERAAALAEADLIISCTAAPEPILIASDFAKVLAQRPDYPLFCYDLAVPRDIAPAAGTIPGVTLRDVDDLTPVGEATRQQRQAAVTAAEAIVATETARFMDWWRARAVAPAIDARRSHAEAIPDAELARALARLPGLTAREEAVVRDLAGAIVNKLLHQPVTTLKAAPEGANMAQVLHDLFGLPQPAVLAGPAHADADPPPNPLYPLSPIAYRLSPDQRS
jgi:glutamyl-tRNA reductase